MLAVRRVHRWRWAAQLTVLGVVLFAAIRHAGESGPASPSVDALCPFGGVETLWTWVTTGQFISKIHPSNLVLGGALVVSVLLAGNAFCGWVCPFGTVQDGLHRLARALHLPQLRVPRRLDTVLRYGRFVVLAVILVASAQTATLWFAGYDPYVTLFGLHWFTEPDPAAMWPAWVILGVVLVGSLLVERAWCRYLCPLGGALSVLGRLSILRIRRSATACTGCDLCVKPCPVGIDVAAPKPAVSSDCIGCLECVANCPTGGALEVQAAPPWQSLRKRISLGDNAVEEGVGALGPVPVTIGRRRGSDGTVTSRPVRHGSGDEASHETEGSR